MWFFYYILTLYYSSYQGRCHLQHHCWWTAGYILTQLRLVWLKSIFYTALSSSKFISPFIHIFTRFDYHMVLNEYIIYHIISINEQYGKNRNIIHHWKSEQKNTIDEHLEETNVSKRRYYSKSINSKSDIRPISLEKSFGKTGSNTITSFTAKISFILYEYF